MRFHSAKGTSTVQDGALCAAMALALAGCGKGESSASPAANALFSGRFEPAVLVGRRAVERRHPHRVRQDRIRLRNMSADAVGRLAAMGVDRQVAEQLGYEDVYYFSRLFRKVVGMAPSHYRALHQG